MYYHGTDNHSAGNILENGTMKPSKGDDHWLGDGFYFYRDEEYAFRWILMKYTDNFRNEYAIDYNNIYSEYTILAAIINKNIRIFSMQDVNNKLFFLRTKRLLTEKAKYSDRFKKQIKNKGIVDGVIFNVMFEDMGLEEEFDAVEAVFPIIFVQGDSRLEYLPEEQICIRRFDIIDKIYKYNGETVPETYKGFINEYNQSKVLLIKKNKENRAKMYKKKFQQNNRYHMRGK